MSKILTIAATASYIVAVVLMGVDNMDMGLMVLIVGVRWELMAQIADIEERL